MRALKFLAACLLLTDVAFAQDAPAPKQQLDETLQNLAKTKEEQASIQQKISTAQKELQQLQDHSAALAERLQVSERRVSGQERSLATANTKVSTKQQEFEARKAEYAQTIATLLRMHEMPVTAIFAAPEDVSQLMLTASILQKTNAAAAAKARALAKDLNELKSLKQDAAQQRTMTISETEALKAEQAQLEKAVKARQRLVTELTSDQSRTEEKVATLSRHSESLKTLIEKLDNEAREQASKTKEKPPQPPVRKFEGKKGNLRAPVAGEILHRFGEHKSNNETYRGIVYKARPGATVVAPYDGEVVYTGPFRDYGNILLIKHQNGYISLIAGLGNTTATLNQHVIRGEPVATMGTDKPEAYVELRDSNAKPIDPGDWFANVGQSVTPKP